MIAGGFFNFFLKIAASIAYFILMMTGYFLGACGTLFNVALQITTHLGNFINSNPAIYTVWSTIRDFSSLILIFLILYAAMQIILGLKQLQFKSFLSQIVIAGILINFSFFFASFFIDISNIISLQFFNAIAPEQHAIYSPNDSIATIITKAGKDYSGGISGVFSTALKVGKFWSSNGILEAAISNSDTKQLIGLTLANYTGAIAQFLAGISFLAASIAALWRTVVLIFLLGFSSIWIAAHAVPDQLMGFKETWMKHFRSNLVFLPVYLALMYISILIITKTDLNNIVANVSSGNDAMSNFIGLLVSFTFVLFFVNAPLMGALTVSSLGSDVIKKMSKWSQDFAINSTIGVAKKGALGTYNYGARQTVGRAAYSINESEAMRNFMGRNPALGTFASKQVGKLSSAKFGLKKGQSYESAIKDQQKTQKEAFKRIGTVDRTKYATKELADQASGRAKEAQARYVANLPYKSSLLAFALDNRSNRKTAADLQKQIEKEAKKEAKKKAAPLIKEKRKEISNLDEQVKTVLPRGTPEEWERWKKDRRKVINEEIDKLQEAIDEGTAVEEEEKESKRNDKLDEIDKKINKEDKGDK